MKKRSPRLKYTEFMGFQALSCHYLPPKSSLVLYAKAKASSINPSTVAIQAPWSRA